MPGHSGEPPAPAPVLALAPASGQIMEFANYVHGHGGEASRAKQEHEPWPSPAHVEPDSPPTDAAPPRHPDSATTVLELAVALLFILAVGWLTATLVIALIYGGDVRR